MSTNQNLAKAASARHVTPLCDVYENADEYLIVAEMPGVKQDAVDIRLDRAELIVEAIRETTRETTRQATGQATREGPTLGARSRSESGNGASVALRYRRVFEVPQTINPDELRAELRDGLLYLHLSKAPEARVRQIPVRAGGTAPAGGTTQAGQAGGR
jgi:HSP20 family molecular chaperone IbpA